MDRGIVHKNVRLTMCDVQICRLDLGDDGEPFLFLTACSPPSDIDDGWTDPGPDTPVGLDDLGRQWPEVAGLADLDHLIAELQAERDWIAQSDPEKRKDL